MKAYMVMAGRDYVVGYVKAGSAGQAKRIAIQQGVTDFYGYTEIRPLRAESLDGYAFAFIDAGNVGAEDESALRERGLMVGTGDGERFYAKPVKDNAL